MRAREGKSEDQGNFIGYSRQWFESAVSDGSDDHFTWVLAIFSIEK